MIHPEDFHVLNDCVLEVAKALQELMSLAATIMYTPGVKVSPAIKIVVVSCFCFLFCFVFCFVFFIFVISLKLSLSPFFAEREGRGSPTVGMVPLFLCRPLPWGSL